MRDRVFVICFLLLALTIKSQSVIGSYTSVPSFNSARTLNKITAYENRIYALGYDTLSNHRVTKFDLQGNVIWSRVYTITGGVVESINAGAGRVVIGNASSLSSVRTVFIDTLDGTVHGHHYNYICPPWPQNSSTRDVILDNNLYVKIGCDPAATSKPTLWTYNSVTGASVSAVRIDLPVEFGGYSNPRIAKIGPNSILLYCSSTTSLIAFAKITNPTNLSGVSFKILKKHSNELFLPDLCSEYTNTGSCFMLFRNNFGSPNTSNKYMIIKTDSSLSNFNGWIRDADSNIISSINISNNSLYLDTYQKLPGTNRVNVLQMSDYMMNNVTGIEMNTSTYASWFGTPVSPSRHNDITSYNNYWIYSYNPTLIISSVPNPSCTNTATVPAWTNITLEDSIQTAVITTSLINMMSYSYSTTLVTQTASVLSNISCSTAAVTTGVKNHSFLESVYLYLSGNNEYTIISSGDELISGIKLYNLSGKTIRELNNLNTNRKEIHLDNEARGMYLVEIISRKNISVFKKIIVQ